MIYNLILMKFIICDGLICWGGVVSGVYERFY